MPAYEEVVRRRQEAKMISDEEAIKELLGRWVSELEPAVAYQNFEVIGLTPAESDLGSKPFILRR